MKKKYISPENTVVSINLETLIAESPVSGTSGAEGLGIDDEGGTSSGGINEANSREVIRSRGAWEEW